MRKSKPIPSPSQKSPRASSNPAATSSPTSEDGARVCNPPHTPRGWCSETSIQKSDPSHLPPPPPRKEYSPLNTSSPTPDSSLPINSVHPPLPINPATVKSNVRFIAAQLGFDDCRIAAATRAPHADDYLQWVADGKAGDMKWLERNVERRCDPREVLPGAQSIITLALNYFPGRENPAADYRIARYAWNDDYHDLIEDKLRDFDLSLQDMGGTQRYYTDTGPVLERDFATEAGLGWNGKSTVQIHTKLGTWFFLAELLTTLDLEPDHKQNDHCGKCTACMTACPTGAIPRPHHVDAPRCISYLTIEHKGSIPEDLRPLIGDRIYGCDDCLDACPWNRFAKLSRETRFHARQSVFNHSLRDFLSITVEDFRTLFAKSPIKRIKRERFLRNVCVALGNTGSKADLPALQQSVADPDPLVSEHATWAIARIQSR